MNRKFLKLIVALIDVLIFFAALVLVLAVRYGFDDLWPQLQLHFFLFALLAAVWMLNFYIADLYDLLEPFNGKRFLFCMAVNLVIAVFLFYAVPAAPISPKTNLALFVVLYSVLFVMWRSVFELLLDRLGIRKPIVFVGLDDHALELANTIVSNPRLGYALIGYVVGEDGGSDSSVPAVPQWLREKSITIMQNMKNLASFIEKDVPHTVVVSENWYRTIYQDLYRLFPQGIKVYQLSTFWENIKETIPVNATDEIWFLQNMSRGPYSLYHLIKRAADIFLVVVFLPLILLVGLLTAILVKVTSRGPAIFKQERIGLRNETFTLYKFRSMKVDAEKEGAVWAVENDPRLTPVGNFLRRFRLDEIPQLLNVLRGEMSIVGPRPERPEFVDQLAKKIPHYNLRHLVKPGLTGWAQVKYRYGSSVEDSEIKLMHDLYYVKNISPLLDIKILLKTVLTIISRSGR